VKVQPVAPRQARVVSEPVGRGVGPTLGHSRRRVLLSSMPGAAITEVEIEGVLHEYTSIEGVQEDVVDILLNLKQVALRMHTRDSAELRLFTRVQTDRDLLQVQQNVDDVFLHAFDARVLVQHAVDLSFGDCTTGHGRQQHAPERVAERVTEATLERFDNDLRLLGGGRGYFDDARLQEFANGCLHGGLTCL
jgi:hypothetical protein